MMISRSLNLYIYDDFALSAPLHFLPPLSTLMKPDWGDILMIGLIAFFLSGLIVNESYEANKDLYYFEIVEQHI